MPSGAFLRKRFILAGIVVGGVGAGCSGEVGLSDPPPVGSGNLRPGLTVNVSVTPEAAAVARALGWAGGVPGAEVRVHRIGTDFAWETAIADSGGSAYLPHLVSGRYRVAVYRPLTDEESAEAGVSALAAGRIVEVFAGGTEQTMELVPNRIGSLVISEVYAPSTPSREGFSYNFHMFFEVYNNSDRTVFLDGLTFGRAQFIDIATPFAPCVKTAPVRKDPEGIWTVFLHRFPGTGGQYPLAPGEEVVVAMDAIDHSVVDPRLPDLSDADFELFGSGDVDNPDSPNLVEVGLQSWFHGHGLLFYVGHSLFIANEVDTSSLERLTWSSPAGDSEMVRVPSADLIDVVWTEDDNARQDQQFARCDGVVHGSFDQLGGGYLRHGVELNLSLQRIQLPGAAGAGAARRLQDTNVSAVDLIKGPYTPGTGR